MKNKYYAEEPVKDSRYRIEYRDSITEFLKAENEKRHKERRCFFSPEEYKKDSEKSRDLYREILGFPLNEKTKEKAILIEKSFVICDGNVNIYRMQFSVSGIKFYGVFFEQTEKAENAPFVFGLHGGEGTPETVGSIYDNSTNYNHLVRRLTDRGCSVFCPQFLLWNKGQYGAEYDRSDVNNKLRMMGGSVTALEVFLMIKILDYFIENEKINKERIGVAGLSYGGQFSLDFAACDTRIKVCSSLGFFNDRFVCSENDWSYFGALDKICDAEKAALICPRALCVSIGDDDYIFDHKYALGEGEYAKSFFEEFGVPENYNFYVFTGSHETDKSDRWVDFLMNNI